MRISNADPCSICVNPWRKFFLVFYSAKGLTGRMPHCTWSTFRLKNSALLRPGKVVLRHLFIRQSLFVDFRLSAAFTKHPF
jgi:hypothetical protein